MVLGKKASFFPNHFVKTWTACQGNVTRDWRWEAMKAGLLHSRTTHCSLHSPAGRRKISSWSSKSKLPLPVANKEVTITLNSRFPLVNFCSKPTHPIPLSSMKGQSPPLFSRLAYGSL